MHKNSSKIREEHIYCRYCRNVLERSEEKEIESHMSCQQEFVEFKSEMGMWYYLELVNATIDDCTFDIEGRLISLDLSGRHLTDLPPLPFKHLQVLNLANNFLDHIPAWVFELRELRTAIFPGNGYSESLLFDMLLLNQKGVEVLSTGCRFDAMNRLIQINLAYLGPTTPLDLPDEILLHFGSVRVVNLSWNGLGTIPTWVLDLPHLTDLRLQGNRLEEIFEPRFRSRSIAKVNLAENGLTFIPNWLSRCESLKELVIARNYIEELPVWLYEMPNLEELAISDDMRHSVLADDLQSLEDNGVRVKTTEEFRWGW